MRVIDLSGSRFGMLVVTGRSAREVKNHTVWSCICDCGKATDAISNNLRRGLTESCGCNIVVVNAARMLRHGHARKNAVTTEHKIWMQMLQRCNNSNDSSYANYGGRGIKVCQRWHTFENFLADMGSRPQGKSIDRFPNNDGNYEPGNTRWATPKEQANNTRRSKR